MGGIDDRLGEIPSTMLFGCLLSADQKWLHGFDEDRLVDALLAPAIQGLQMKRITFSALPRLFECPVSHILPWVEDEEASEFRDRGVNVHDYLEHYREFGPDAAIQRVPEEHRAFCELIDVDSLPLDLTPEASLAYDPWTRTGRVLTRKFRRDYSQAKDHEICGTVDVLGLAELTAYIGDYKTGWAKLLGARENPQLLMGGLAACRAFGKESAVLELIEVREGKNWHDRAVVDAFELLAFEKRLQQLLVTIEAVEQRRVAGSTGSASVHPGSHCRYCPAFQACPEQIHLASDVADGTLAEEVERWTGVLTATTAREAYSKVKAMRMLAKRASNILAAYASKRPIDLGGGRYYGLVKTRGNEKLDGDIVFTQAVRLFGHDIANAMVSRTATKTAIKAALRTNKTTLKESKLSQKDALETLLEAVRDADGATRKPSTRLDEFDAPEEE